MTSGLAALVPAVLIGAGATLLMDIWALCLKHFLNISSLNRALVGRLLGHLPGGHFVHKNIAEASPVRGEAVLGWCAHYAVGIVLAIVFVALIGEQWLTRPTLLPAIIFGLITVIFPFLLMQPAMGAGIAASKTPNPLQS